MKTSYKLGVIFLLSLLFCSVLSDHIVTCQHKYKCQKSKMVLEKEIYVNERCGNYYAYEVYSDNGKIIIQLLDKDVKEWQFTFESKKNKLQYRVAYNKFIIVEEKTEKGKSVSYWVLTIVKTTKGYKLQNFPVSSKVDNQGFQFNDTFLLTRVIEYDEINQFLYVVLESQPSYIDIYGIDLKNKGKLLIIVGWFEYLKKEQFVGGNSRVLVQKTYDNFWFDTRNIRKGDGDPTIYEKVCVDYFTKLPIYPKGSLAYSFFSSYFQYVSLSKDKTKISTFLYKGYEKTKKVYAEASLKSSKPIKIFSNEQQYFLAIGDKDVYVSVVHWNETLQDYGLWSNKLTEFISDKKEIKKWLQVFNSVEYIFFSQGRFFMLSEKYFYVYSRTQSYEKLLKKPLTASSDVEKVMLSYVKEYLCQVERK